MADEKIGLRRPTNDADFKQPKIEKDMMVFSVITGYPNPYVYGIFNPHLVNQSTGKLNEAGAKECRMFFSHPTNVAFMDAYKETIKGVLGGKKTVVKGVEISDDRIDDAFKTFIKQALENIEDGKEIDNDTFKLLMELFKKLGRFKDEEQQVEAPRRYLPERCSTCKYKQFIDENVRLGNIEEVDDN